MKARRTDLKFTQAEVRFMLDLLLYPNPNPSNSERALCEKLRQKFRSIDYREQRKPKSKTKKARTPPAAPTPDKSQLQFWEPGDIQPEAD